MMTKQQEIIIDTVIKNVSSEHQLDPLVIPQADKQYAIIYADPPWKYSFPGTRTEDVDDYETMNTEDICRMNVKSLAGDNSVLFIWGIWTKLPDILKVIDAWGFEYKTVGFVWVKANKNAATEQYSFLPEDSLDDFFGMGMWTRSNTEFCLIGTRGENKRITNDVRQVVYAPIREHSRKPDEVRERIVKLMGNKTRLEMFARQRAEGWDVFGNEVECSIGLTV